MNAYVFALRYLSWVALALALIIILLIVEYAPLAWTWPTSTEGYERNT